MTNEKFTRYYKLIFYIALQTMIPNLGKFGNRWYWHRRLEDRIVKPVHKFLYPNPDGIEVMNESWDNLMIFDACRADLFEDTVSIDDFDNYRTVVSGGSESPEWLRYNFEGEQFGDTVYVNANAYTPKIVPNNFHKLVDLSEEWEDGSATADIVAEATREAFEKYPNKRFIIHFMQPHGPIVADNNSLSQRPSGKSLYYNKLSLSDYEQAYKRNLQHVIQPAMNLSKHMGGKTVITSDHGHMHGEYAWPVPIRMYDTHCPHVRTPELNHVPWAEIHVGSRREVKDDGVSTNSEPEAEKLEERLAALGYKKSRATSDK